MGKRTLRNKAEQIKQTGLDQSPLQLTHKEHHISQKIH